jgi:hypothetical protein
MFEKSDVNGYNERPLFTFLKVTIRRWFIISIYLFEVFMSITDWWNSSMAEYNLCTNTFEWFEMEFWESSLIELNFISIEFVFIIVFNRFKWSSSETFCIGC